MVFQPVRVLRLCRSHLLRMRRRFRAIFGPVRAMLHSLPGSKFVSRRIFGAGQGGGKGNVPR